MTVAAALDTLANIDYYIRNDSPAISHLGRSELICFNYKNKEVKLNLPTPIIRTNIHLSDTYAT